MLNLAKWQGFNPTVLDIGGGFQDGHFESMASIVTEAIREQFPSGVTVIAEPGRYYARSAYTLVSQVIARRCQVGKQAAAGVPDMLYQNDGVYGNFMNVIMEKEKMDPCLFLGKRSKEESLVKTTPTPDKDKIHSPQTAAAGHRYSIWGPTCDSMDCVVREMAFDSEVKVGDWLIYRNMGGKCRHHLLAFDFAS